jgi:hypothetical protein
MCILSRYFLALFAASIFLASCSRATHTTSDVQPVGARLTKAEAIQIAQQAAEHDGRQLGNYKAPEARYEFTQKDRSWWVFFDGKVGMPGNQFWVSIDDFTGKTQIISGL